MATAGVSTGRWLEVPGQSSQSLRLGCMGSSSSSSGIGGGGGSMASSLGFGSGGGM